MNELKGSYKALFEHVHSKLCQCYDLGVEVPVEMFCFLDVMLHGAKKYAPNNWLEEDGAKSNHKDMHSSLLRHAAASFGGTDIDKDSGFYHLQNAATRALMLYTRKKRGIVHVDDKKGVRL